MKRRLPRIALGLVVVAISACSLVRDLDELEQRSPADGGADADGSVGPEGGACPPSMVQERFGDGTRFCVDSTEVTQAAYADFLAKGSKVVPKNCAMNASLRPDEANVAACAGSFDPASRGAYPVVCVDFCDAATFCASRGARLCASKAGDELSAEDVNAPGKDEWLVACGATRTFASGEDAGACVFNQPGPSLAATGGCPTPEGVLHMSGNVGEWVASCRTGAGGGEPRCLVRGGDFADTDPQRLACARAPSIDEARVYTTRATTIGFRCCKSL